MSSSDLSHSASEERKVAGRRHASKIEGRPSQELWNRELVHRNWRKGQKTVNVNRNLPKDVKIVKPATGCRFSLPVTEQCLESEEMSSSVLPPSDSEERKETLSRVESSEEVLSSGLRAGHHAVVETVQHSRLKAVRSDVSGLLTKRKETWSHDESLVSCSTSSSRAGVHASIQAVQPGSISASKPAKFTATSFNVPGMLKERKGSWSKGSRDRKNCPSKMDFSNPIVNLVSSVRLPCPETFNELDPSGKENVVYGSVIDKNDWTVVHRKYRRKFFRP